MQFNLAPTISPAYTPYTVSAKFALWRSRFAVPFKLHYIGADDGTASSLHSSVKCRSLGQPTMTPTLDIMVPHLGNLPTLQESVTQTTQVPEESCCRPQSAGVLLYRGD